MKKTYNKPDIIFEDFSLSTNIAAGCEEYPFNNTDQCGVYISKGKILFGDGFVNCNKSLFEIENPKYNDLCYHNPTETYNVFNS